MGILSTILAVIRPASRSVQAGHEAQLHAHEEELLSIKTAMSSYSQGHNNTALSFLDIFGRLKTLEHKIMTEQAALDALTVNVTALEGVVTTLRADVVTAINELATLKAEVVALTGAPAGTDNSAALTALAARIDTITAGLQGTATSVETAVTAATA
jgi:hypothetical protein